MRKKNDNANVSISLGDAPIGILLAQVTTKWQEAHGKMVMQQGLLRAVAECIDRNDMDALKRARDVIQRAAEGR